MMASNGPAPAAQASGKQDSPRSVDSVQKVSFSVKAAEEKSARLNAGTLIVLESKGDWWHAGYHLCSAIVGVALLSIPVAISLLGWYAGVFALLFCGAVSMYAYSVLSTLLDRAEEEGHRQVRYRDLARYILGRTWAYYIVGFVQLVVCYGSVAVLILFGGTFTKNIYLIYRPHGGMKLYQFIAMFGGLALFFAQIPSFHSLRHINFLGTVLTLTYSGIAFGGCIYAGHSSKAPEKNYSITTEGIDKTFNILNALAIITTLYGSAVVPEIQATIAPPAAGKMLKGLFLCYAVVWSTFFSVGVSGYWAFGNQVSANVLQDLSPVLPRWLSVLANVLAVAQLVTGTMVYMQPCFDLLEGKSADPTKSRFSTRNLLPRLVVRSLAVAIATLLAAMFPFIGDALAIIGAFGFIPLDFIFPFIFHLVALRPSPRTYQFWLSHIIAAIFLVVALLAGISSTRQLIIDAKHYKLFANV